MLGGLFLLKAQVEDASSVVYAGREYRRELGRIEASDPAAARLEPTPARVEGRQVWLDRGRPAGPAPRVIYLQSPDGSFTAYSFRTRP